MNELDISCDEVIERLFDFLNQELNDDTRTQIDRHLERCHDCFSRAEFERRLRERVLMSGTQKAPDRLRERVRQLISNKYNF